MDTKLSEASFIESAIPTRAEYEVSRRLPAAECAALERSHSERFAMETHCPSHLVGNYRCESEVSDPHDYTTKVFTDLHLAAGGNAGCQDVISYSSARLSTTGLGTWNHMVTMSGSHITVTLVESRTRNSAMGVRGVSETSRTL